MISTFKYWLVLLFTVCIVSCGGGGGGSAGDDPGGGEVDPPTEIDPPDEGSGGNTYSGASLYADLCAGCHGMNGEGVPPSPKIKVANYSNVDQLMRRIRDTMPPTSSSTGGSPADCDEGCATDIAAFIFNDFTVSELDTPSEEVTIKGASTRRLSADMLKASIPVLMGHDISWQLSRNTDAIDALSATLGKPDYVALTEEVRDPSALYVKLMYDMALDICGQAIDKDYSVAASARALVLVPELDDKANGPEIHKNLRYLKLRLHGSFIAETNLAATEDLKNLFDMVALESGASAKDGWEAVCVAMVSSPEFHLY